MEENEKKELALQIIDRLKKAYPDADCTLDYDDAWKLLVSVRLACFLQVLQFFPLSFPCHFFLFYFFYYDFS